MHDLVRSYAATVAENLPIPQREAALRRVVDLYTSTAHTADRLLNPHREPLEFDSSTTGTRPYPLADDTAAWVWLDTERACLLAAQHSASVHHWHTVVWHLAWALETFFYCRGHRNDRLTVWRTATDAAAHMSDPTAGVRAHRTLGLAYTELGHHDNGITHLHHALELATEHRTPTHQALTHRALAWVWEHHGDDRRAMDHALLALDVYRDLDQPTGEAHTLNAVGWYAARLGDYDTAHDHCQAALRLHQLHHDRDGEAGTLDSLGYIDHFSGHHHQAIDNYERALTLFHDLRNTYEIANTLDRLGHSHIALAQSEAAYTVWQEAARLYRKQEHDDDAERMQGQLNDLDGH